MVQTDVIIIIVQTETTKTLPLKILTQTESIYCCCDKNREGFLPVVECKYRYFREAKDQGCGELRSKKSLSHFSSQSVQANALRE